MPLYTIMLDFAGGTYLAQVEATGPKAAVTRWAREVTPEVALATGFSGSEFAEAFKHSSAVRVTGLRDVWCTSGLLGDSLALIHVVRTGG